MNNLSSSNYSHWTILFPLIAIFSLTPAPDHAQSEQFNTESFKTYSTIRVNNTFDLQANRGTIHFLLSNLDLTCAIIRGWNLEAFRAQRIAPRRYRARDGAGLKGTIREVNSSDTSFSFFGKGRYRSSSLPLTLRGKALAEIDLLANNADTTTIHGRLYVKANNTIVHLMSQFFYPLLKSLARGKTQHLTKIAKKTINKITRRPEETERRLRPINPAFGGRWENFVSNNEN